MIQLKSIRLSDKAEAQLGKWQKEVNEQSSFSVQVALGKQKFSARNQKDNKTFQAVKMSLTEMCSGSRRCCYCEDSVADEVEHIRPKDFFPEGVFCFDNYLYACGPCNGPKSNKYRIRPNGALVPIDLDKQKELTERPDPEAFHYLINPRFEDPFQFLVLDLASTFFFTVHPNCSGDNAARATYTLEILALNTRDYLVRARQSAFGHYLARAEQYDQRKLDDPDDPDLPKFVLELGRLEHPTVWAEMKRQRDRIPRLDAILRACPELL
jgi:uncharacterized protein (TIGR02646 family)